MSSMKTPLNFEEEKLKKNTETQMIIHLFEHKKHSIGPDNLSKRILNPTLLEALTATRSHKKTKSREWRTTSFENAYVQKNYPIIESFL